MLTAAVWSMMAALLAERKVWETPKSASPEDTSDTRPEKRTADWGGTTV